MPSSGQASQVEYFSAILFRQQAASIYGFVRFVSFVSFRQKRCLSKQPCSLLLDSLLQQVNMKDDLRLKTNLDGRRPSMEDDLIWKTTFNRRRPLMEDKYCLGGSIIPVDLLRPCRNFLLKIIVFRYLSCEILISEVSKAH